MSAFYNWLRGTLISNGTRLKRSVWALHLSRRMGLIFKFLTSFLFSRERVRDCVRSGQHFVRESVTSGAKLHGGRDDSQIGRNQFTMLRARPLGKTSPDVTATGPTLHRNVIKFNYTTSITSPRPPKQLRFFFVYLPTLITQKSEV